MDDTIRMNQKISRSDDQEIFDYLNGFGERNRAAQARKLMLLGLVQLNRLSSGVQEPMEIPARTREPVKDDEQELIVNSGVGGLF